MDLNEVKAAVDGLNTAFAEFKRANDERLKQIEAKGFADPALSEKLDRINADIDRFQGIVTDHQSALNRLEKAGGAAGDGLTAEQREYKTAYQQYLRRGIESKALSVGSDPDGGYTVTPDMGGRIVTRIYESSPVRQIAAVQAISTDRLEGLRDPDEAAASWVSETGARSATNTPQFAKWEIAVHELYANPGVTQKLLDDSNIDIEAWLADKVADKFARTQNTAFVSGDGVGKPRGFASYTTAATADASRTWGQLEHVNTGANGSFGSAPNGSDKLIDVVHKLNPAYRDAAVWVMPRATVGAVRQLKANSEYIWLPSMQAGQPSSLLGFPVVEAEDIAAYTVTNALGVAFGNFGAGYQIVDRIGMRTLRDPYTNKPYVQFYTTARVGGDVVDFNAIKFLRFGT